MIAGCSPGRISSLYRVPSAEGEQCRALRCGKPGIRAFALRRWKELLIAVNSAFILASIPATATKMPSAMMPAAIRQYSIAVAAFSSAQETYEQRSLTNGDLHK
jgi:hypothetical protein